VPEWIGFSSHIDQW